MLSYVKLLRVHHWVKNTFVFIPAFFSGDLFNVSNFFQLFVGFVAFGFVASSIYIVNDYKDMESDKLHPKKKERPLAAGTAKPLLALLIATLLLTSGLLIAYSVNNYFLAILGLYFALNLAYSLGLKNISVLDVMMLSFGFLLRAYSGGVIIDVFISQWLIIMVFLLAVFMAIAKRRDDVLMYLQSGTQARKSINGYNLEFINTAMSMLCGVVVVAYLMYTVSTEVTSRLHSNHIYLTIVFVIAGMLRYLQITFVDQKSASPTKILYSDKFIILTILGWLISFYFIIYFPTFIK
jgi:4-hydroxybenzoate polyprenyltransferase